MVRDVSPLGRNHGELATNDLFGDGLMTKVLMKGRITAQTERDRKRERGGGERASERATG